MGTKLGQLLANIFMGWFEDNYVYNYKLQPLSWKRYRCNVIVVVYKMKTWKQEFLVMVYILHYSIQIQQ